ncbi:NADPH-dependent FMN reductase [Dehalogenimonas etheniformans]|uniref:NADPH-dependent oxidoreductase n=1 Tax=Dehalogenimonas etheniformans TaxID=1536648 RepID=A0A2P5P6Z6_9CHLR|nr:NAD(P)H-dependent oxidoreductase [Dehalogenimonas etheniformans]PPD58081.1 NADPH-dependent oxidoreductase [Dehalogenimonas etheniformans]QNT75268.1 NAD(P)H-dependent oxidoreductase [Dehalogenimonas etheniformans]
MQTKIKVLGFAGSLRQGSFNRMLLKTAVELAPPGIDLQVFDLAPIPPFNQDQEHSLPGVVREFKSLIDAADAILFVTPEANYSVPGVMKNAIDWASRPHGDNSFKDKPAAIMSASTSSLGGARAQYHLRQMMVFLEMHPVNKPEVMVPLAAQAFDSDGNLIDQKARDLVKQLLNALYDWTLRLKCNPIQ